MTLATSALLASEVDVLALATNGAVTEQSEGVRVLSEEEMKEVVGGYRGASWYSYTYNQMPYQNNYNANTRPQTNNQKILSNAFMKCYNR